MGTLTGGHGRRFCRLCVEQKLRDAGLLEDACAGSSSMLEQEMVELRADDVPRGVVGSERDEVRVYESREEVALVERDESGGVWRK